MNRFGTRRAPVLSELLIDDAPVRETSVDTRRADVVEAVETARRTAVEVDEAEDRVTTLREASEVLEQISEIVAGAISDDDDVDDTTEAVVRQTANVGLRRARERLAEIPSTESEASPKARLMLTMESISDTLKRIVEAIKNAIKRVVEILTRFFENYIGALATSKALAKELTKDIKDLTWSEMVDTTSSYAAKITVTEKLPASWVTDTFGYLKSLAVADGDMFDLTFGISDMFIEEYKKTIKSKEYGLDLNKYGKSFENYFNSLNKKLAGVATTPSKTGKPEGEKGGITPVRSGLLPGGKVLVHKEPTPGSDATTYFVNATGIMGPNMVTIESEKEFKTTVLPAPTKATLISTVDAIPAFVDGLIADKRARHEKATKLSKDAVGFLTNGILNGYGDAGVDVQNGLKMFGVLARHSLVISKPIEQYMLFLLPAYLHALSDVVKSYK